MSRGSFTSSFPAMTTTVTVVSVGVPEGRHRRAMEAIIAETTTWEHRFSRFRPQSMLARVNASAGRWVQADGIFLDLLETARDAVFATHGRFNPAILAALEAHGYDRTIGTVQSEPHPCVSALPAAVPVANWSDVGIDRRGTRARLPEGLRIDLGGIAKGALADHLAQRFEEWPGGAISIGGDMSTWGTPPDGDRWRVGIEHPLDPHRDIASVQLPDARHGAIATSSRTKRVWSSGTGSAHHLLDPATGAPAESSLLAVSVCAPTATLAEIVTKNLMVASAHGPLTADLLLDARWALTVSDSLDLARITKEAA